MQLIIARTKEMDHKAVRRAHETDDSRGLANTHFKKTTGCTRHGQAQSFPPYTRLSAKKWRVTHKGQRAVFLPAQPVRIRRLSGDWSRAPPNRHQHRSAFEKNLGKTLARWTATQSERGSNFREVPKTGSRQIKYYDGSKKFPV